MIKIPSIVKKTFALALAGGMIFGAAGCGSIGSSSGGDSSSTPVIRPKESTHGGVAEAKNMADSFVYSGSNFDVSGIEGTLSSIKQSGDKIYMLYQTFKEDENSKNNGDGDQYIAGETIYRIYSVSKEGGQADLLFESDPMGFDGYMTNLIVKQDGTPFIVNNNVDENEGAFYHICSISDGKLKTERNITNLVYDTEINLNTLFLDDNNNLIATTDNEIKVYDSDNKEIMSKSFGDVWITSLGKSASGDILVNLQSYNGAVMEDCCKLYVFDKDTYEMKKEIDMDTSGVTGGGSIMTGDETYDFYYSTTNAIYGYVIDEEKSYKLADFLSSDIDGDSLGNICMLNANAFIGGLYDWEEDTIRGSKCTLMRYDKVDPSSLANTTVLTYAMMYADNRLKADIREFNNSQSEYRINIVDYSEENDPAGKLSADVAAGNYADIYQVYEGMGDISLNQAISKGLLEDMTPYFEKDADVSLDDLVPAVKNAIVNDGKVYIIAPTFELYTMVGKKSEVGEKSGWTYDEMKKYYDSKPDSQLFYSNNKNDVLNNIMEGCVNDFVDWEKGECYFDSQDFKDILEMANRGTNDETDYVEDRVSEPKQLLEGKRLVYEGYFPFDEIQRMSLVFKDDYAIKGFPTKEGSGTFIYLSYDAMGICAKSENKDAAWAFVKRYMTEEYQGKKYPELYCCPTRQDVFDVYVETKKATKQGTDKYGNEIKPVEGSYGWEDMEITQKPITDEQIKIFKDALDNAKGLFANDKKVEKIISEEAASYFAGDKSLEEVVPIIQDRVRTYINENK
jgi:ABC-type glycerol-3-phosphate transport system substrate-binding protein